MKRRRERKGEGRRGKVGEEGVRVRGRVLDEEQEKYQIGDPFCMI